MLAALIEALSDMPGLRPAGPGELSLSVQGTVYARAPLPADADVAVFAGDRRGIIYVQGEKVANVPEEEILGRLLTECLQFQDKVKKGEAKLGEKKVEALLAGNASSPRRWPRRPLCSLPLISRPWWS